jgi:hypothetical protein
MEKKKPRTLIIEDDDYSREAAENSRTLKFTSQGARWNRSERFTFVRQMKVDPITALRHE